MHMMIVCRGIQGFGGGILIPVSMAAVADFYAPQERGKVQGMLGAVFGLGSGAGPLVGGLICTVASWHYIFFINIPLSAVCLVLTLKKFPSVAKSERKRIDFIGMSLITLLILDTLLYFQWIINDMAFTDPRSILMILAAVVLLAAFIIRERRAEDPVLSPALSKNRVIVFS